MYPNCVVFGIGNESRGDDALGPLFLEKLKISIKEKPFFSSFTLISDFQLQIEHSLDLENQDIALFIDAGLSPAVPDNEAFSFKLIQAIPSRRGMTHALSPEELLGVAEDFFAPQPQGDTSTAIKTNCQRLPKAYVLCIRGYQFELGAAICKEANINLELAFTQLMSWIDQEVYLKSGGSICMK